MAEFNSIRDTPFILALRESEALTCHEVVRAIPGRRLVCRGTWAGRAVYAKLFSGRHAARYAARDAQGVARVAAAGIATPTLLHAGQAADATCEVLIFAEVVDSQSAEALWPALDHDQRYLLAMALVREVAGLHKAGLLQTDLYLKNFLLQGDKLYTLDGDGIRKFPVLFPVRAAWANLALLLSKFDVCDLASWLPDLMQTYLTVLEAKAIPLERLASLVEKQRHRVVDGYADRKVFRNCTDVVVDKNWRLYIAYMRDVWAGPDLIAADKLDALVDTAGRARLKSGNTCTVALAEIAGRKVVVKRYNIKNWLHGLGRLWRSSRASVSWANAHRLRMHGIATAAPLGLVERRFGPCRSTAYFLAEFIEVPDMETWMRDRGIDTEYKRVAANKLAKLMYKLRLLQIAHGDMKATNLHVDDTAAPVLIDLDSMRHYRCRWWFERQHVKDLKRLLRNWADRPHIQRMVIEALQQTYGHDPVLKKAGI